MDFMTNDLFYSRDQAKALRFSFGELNCSGGGYFQSCFPQ